MKIECFPSVATPTPILFLDMPLSFFPSFNISSLFFLEKYVSSSHILPSSTTSSCIPLSTSKTLMSLYWPVVFEFLLSAALVLMEWNSKRCKRYSIHSEIGIFLESNMVFDNGLKLCLQSLQKYFCIPSFLCPSFLKCVPSQYGHLSILRELTKATSSWEASLCFAEYHSTTVLSTKVWTGVGFIPSQVKTRKERFLRLYLFIFIGGSEFQEMINQNRQVLIND